MSSTSGQPGKEGPAGSQPGPSYQPGRQLQQTQAQVDEVVGIMRVNVEKVMQRDEKITDLNDRADALQAGASRFEANAGRLKKKYWWQNMKMMIIIGVVVVIIILIIIVAVVSHSGGGGGGGGGAPIQPVTKPTSKP